MDIDEVGRLIDDSLYKIFKPAMWVIIKKMGNRDAIVINEKVWIYEEEGAWVGDVQISDAPTGVRARTIEPETNVQELVYGVLLYVLISADKAYWKGELKS